MDLWSNLPGAAKIDEILSEASKITLVQAEALTSWHGSLPQEAVWSASEAQRAIARKAGRYGILVAVRDQAYAAAISSRWYGEWRTNTTKEEAYAMASYVASVAALVAGQEVVRDLPLVGMTYGGDLSARWAEAMAS